MLPSNIDDDDILDRADEGPYSSQRQIETYHESMQEIWKQCEAMMDLLAKDKQAQIERIVEDVT